MTENSFVLDIEENCVILHQNPPRAEWGEKDTISLLPSNRSLPWYAVITLVKKKKVQNLMKVSKSKTSPSEFQLENITILLITGNFCINPNLLQEPFYCHSLKFVLNYLDNNIDIHSARRTTPLMDLGGLISKIQCCIVIV